jgi:phage/plasmid-associated DNA primase
MLNIERKFEAPFSYRPYVKLVFPINRMPGSGDFSGGFQRRVLIVPFDREFVHNPKEGSELQMKADTGIAEKLLEELDGIFVFAMESLQRLEGNDYQFSSCNVIDERVADYFQTVNPYCDFVETCIEPVFINGFLQRGIKITIDSMYEIFCFWTMKTGNSKVLQCSNKRMVLREIRSILKRKNWYDVSKRNTSGGKNYFPGVRFRDAWRNLIQNVPTS